tara:strand:- start:767 stop:1624 length:858 start_codon:yes stop_codon:yes gene_type:complete
MNCYLCGSTKQIKRRGKPRDNKSLNVFECCDCGLVFLDSFEHINENFYQESGMHDSEIQPDTFEDWLEESKIEDNKRIEKHKSKINGQKILDFGCGSGGFLSKARKYASIVKGIELEKRVKNYWEGNIEIDFNLDKIIREKETFDVITMFHVLEHIKDPISTLKDISKCIKANGEIIIEVPSSEDALLTLYNCEPFQNFSYWSNHLFLFNNNTLKKVIEKAGLKVNLIENYQRYSLSNHLYWLSNGKPNGHKVFSSLNSEILNSSYAEMLGKIKKTDTLIAYASI